jgi:small basic protein
VRLIFGSVLNLTRIPSIYAPPYIAIALTAALAPAVTAVVATAPTTILISGYFDIYANKLSSIINPILNAKLNPKKLTGEGNGR